MPGWRLGDSSVMLRRMQPKLPCPNQRERSPLCRPNIGVQTCSRIVRSDTGTRGTRPAVGWRPQYSEPDIVVWSVALLGASGLVLCRSIADSVGARLTMSKFCHHAHCRSREQLCDVAILVPLRVKLRCLPKVRKPTSRSKPMARQWLVNRELMVLSMVVAGPHRSTHRLGSFLVARC